MQQARSFCQWLSATGNSFHAVRLARIRAICRRFSGIWAQNDSRAQWLAETSPRGCADCRRQSTLALRILGRLWAGRRPVNRVCAPPGSPAAPRLPYLRAIFPMSIS